MNNTSRPDGRGSQKESENTRLNTENTVKSPISGIQEPTRKRVKEKVIGEEESKRERMRERREKERLERSP